MRIASAIWLVFFHGVMAAQRVVETREIAAGPFQIFNATVVRRYDRRMVLGREAELPEAWIGEMFGVNVTVELDVLNGSLSVAHVAGVAVTQVASTTGVTTPMVTTSTGVTTPMVTTPMATATNATIVSDSIAVPDAWIIVLIVIGAMTAIVLVLMACRKKKCHFYKIISQIPT